MLFPISHTHTLCLSLSLSLSLSLLKHTLTLSLARSLTFFSPSSLAALSSLTLLVFSFSPPFFPSSPPPRLSSSSFHFSRLLLLPSRSPDAVSIPFPHLSSLALLLSSFVSPPSPLLSQMSLWGSGRS